MGSLARFMNRTKDDGGQSLHWGRAALDGAPFRGPAPMLMGEEFEERVVRVADPHAEEFDTADPAQKKLYLNVLDGAANQWFQILYIKRPGEYDKNRPRVAYVEWLEYFMEDGTRTPFMSPGMMEVQGGTAGPGMGGPG
jgi:hypothetical protein